MPALASTMQNTALHRAEPSQNYAEYSTVHSRAMSALCTIQNCTEQGIVSTMQNTKLHRAGHSQHYAEYSIAQEGYRGLAKRLKIASFNKFSDWQKISKDILENTFFYRLRLYCADWFLCSKLFNIVLLRREILFLDIVILGL